MGKYLLNWSLTVLLLLLSPAVILYFTAQHYGYVIKQINLKKLAILMVLAPLAGVTVTIILLMAVALSGLMPRDLAHQDAVAIGIAGLGFYYSLIILAMVGMLGVAHWIPRTQNLLQRNRQADGNLWQVITLKPPVTEEEVTEQEEARPDWELTPAKEAQAKPFKQRNPLQASLIVLACFLLIGLAVLLAVLLPPSFFIEHAADAWSNNYAKPSF